MFPSQTRQNLNEEGALCPFLTSLTNWGYEGMRKWIILPFSSLIKLGYEGMGNWVIFPYPLSLNFSRCQTKTKWGSGNLCPFSSLKNRNQIRKWGPLPLFFSHEPKSNEVVGTFAPFLLSSQTQHTVHRQDKA